jgi:hypothetical protein
MGLIVDTKNNSLTVNKSQYPYGYNATASSVNDAVSLFDNNANAYVFRNVHYSDLKDVSGSAFATSASNAVIKINNYLGSSNPDGVIKSTDRITALSGVDYDANDAIGYVLLSDGNGGVNTKPLQSVLADSTEVTSIVFDIDGPPDSLSDGRLAYDIDRETLVFQSAHGELALGEVYKPVINNTPNPIPAGSVVKASGVSGERFEIEKFNAAASSDEELYLIGVTQKEIAASGGEGLVVTQGIVKHINTSGWPVGTLLYADPSERGGLINSVPNSPNLAIPVAMVTKQAANGSIFVRPTIYNHLDEIHDVSIANPSNGQLLTYNSSSGVWQNADAPGGAVESVNGATGVVVLDTDDINEGASNLYYTDQRVESVISAKIADATLVTNINGEYSDGTGEVSLTTASVPESASALYYTEARVAANSAVVANTAKNSYPTADAIKLAGIAAGAEVNVNADWSAASGDAQILNKPTIPDDISQLGGSTDDLPEGQVNLYYTDNRVTSYLSSNENYSESPVVVIASNTALSSAHVNKFLQCDNASEITLQIPSGLKRSAEIIVMQNGAGGVNISAGSGVTIRNTSPFLSTTSEQYALVGLKQLGDTNTWVITGERKLA